MSPQRHCLDGEPGSPWGFAPSMFQAMRSKHHYRCLATAVQLGDIPVQPVISLAQGLGGAPVPVDLGTSVEPASRHRHLPVIRACLHTASYVAATVCCGRVLLSSAATGCIL
jgi:hypothetical protein